MRIISGMRRGLKLNAPDGFKTRPTTDRVKESLFNIIQYKLPAGNVLDLFCGSGALGLEALSRGCGHCVFTDIGRDAVLLTKKNVTAAHFEDRAEVINISALDYLKQCMIKFDIIFLDPPYNCEFVEPAITCIFARSLLKSDGIIAIETEKGGESVPDNFYPIKKSSVYGNTIITILQG